MKKAFLLIIILLLLGAAVYALLEAKKISFDVKEVKPRIDWKNVIKEGALIDVVVEANNRGQLNLDVEIADSKIYVDGNLTAVLKQPVVIHIISGTKTTTTLTYKVVNPKPLANALLKGLIGKQTKIKVTVHPVLIIFGLKIPLPEQTFEKSIG